MKTKEQIEAKILELREQAKEASKKAASTNSHEVAAYHRDVAHTIHFQAFVLDWVLEDK